jgi:hypothetical protein
VKHLRLLEVAPPHRQMTLSFDSRRVEGLALHERNKVILALAQILMQAAGLKVKEPDDDKH